MRACRKKHQKKRKTEQELIHMLFSELSVDHLKWCFEDSTTTLELAELRSTLALAVGHV
jgi:hypothetical protein